MKKQKFKAGDKVIIKSLEWYNENKDYEGIVRLKENTFIPAMSKYCNQVMTIEREKSGFNFALKEDPENWSWTEEMFDLVESKINSIEEKRDYVCKNFDIIEFGGFYVIFDINTKVAISDFFENKDNAIDYVVKKMGT